MKTRYTILLTACVKPPHGMPTLKLTNPQARLAQYKLALDFYLKNTNIPIVFVDNSNYDFSNEYLEFIKIKRLEYHTFSAKYDAKLGKGYGELSIIEYALENSLFLKETDYIIKITGRLIVANIQQLIEDCNKHIYKLHPIAICNINPQLNYTRTEFFVSTARFYNEYMHKYKFLMEKNIERLNYEVLTTLSLKLCQKDHYYFTVFKIPIELRGIGGGTGKIYDKLPTYEYIKVYTKYILYKYHLLSIYAHFFKSLQRFKHRLKNKSFYWDIIDNYIK